MIRGLFVLSVVLTICSVTSAPLAVDSAEAQEIINALAGGAASITTSGSMPTDYTTCKKLGSGQFKQACLLKGGQVVLLYITSPNADAAASLNDEISKLASINTKGGPTPLIYVPAAFTISVVNDGTTINTVGILEQSLDGDVSAATAKICSGFDRSFKTYFNAQNDTIKTSLRAQLKTIYKIYQITTLIADLQVMVDKENNIYIVDPDALCDRREKIVQFKQPNGTKKCVRKLDLTNNPCRESRNHANANCANLAGAPYNITAVTEEMTKTEALAALAFLETDSGLNKQPSRLLKRLH